MHVSVVVLAGALYLAFSAYNRTLVLLGTFLRAAKGVIMAIAIVINIVLPAVAQKFISATGT